MDGTTMDDDFGDDIIAFPPLRAADGSPLPDTPKPNITNPVQPENIFLPDDAHTSTDEASDEEVAADSDDGDNTHSSVTLERRLQLAAGRCAHTHMPIGTHRHQHKIIQTEVGVSLLAENTQLKEDSTRMSDDIKLYRTKSQAANQRAERLMEQLQLADEALEQMRQRLTK